MRTPKRFAILAVLLIGTIATPAFASCVCGCYWYSDPRLGPIFECSAEGCTLSSGISCCNGCRQAAGEPSPEAPIQNSVPIEFLLQDMTPENGLPEAPPSDCLALPLPAVK